jgi:Protein of unknown function (DUF1569)
MTSAINTGKVTGRRQLHFTRLEDIHADVEQLAKSKDIRPLGNWSAGQIFKHLAAVMNGSIDGIPPMMPRFVRFLLRLFMKRRILTKPMSPGFQLPKKAASIIPPPTTLEEGLQSIRQAIHRLQTETRRGDNPVVGPLNVEEWNQLHCRHSELHLSFLVPVQ